MTYQGKIVAAPNLLTHRVSKQAPQEFLGKAAA